MSRIKAVRVACDGEEPHFVRKVTLYDIPLEHDIFTRGELSGPSVRLGVPILVLKLRPSLLRFRLRRLPPTAKTSIKETKKYSYSETGRYFTNGIVRDLMAGADSWQGAVGTVLVARQDKKPLYFQHICAILRFCEAATQLQADDGMSDAEKAELFTPGVFRNYYDSALKEALEWDVDLQGDGELVRIPSLFEDEVVEEGDA